MHIQAINSGRQHVRLHSLPSAGLTFSDTIYLRAFLVADLFLNGTVDYQGWFNAYAQFFNREGSTRTARSTMAVTSLVNPEW